MLRRVKALNPLRAVRRVRQVFAAIDAIPALQNKVEQIMVAQQKDARFADRVDAFRERMDPARLAASTKAAVMRRSETTPVHIWLWTNSCRMISTTSC
jgi:hypothetical protein